MSIRKPIQRCLKIGVSIITNSTLVRESKVLNSGEGSASTGASKSGQSIGEGSAGAGPFSMASMTSSGFGLSGLKTS